MRVKVEFEAEVTKKLEERYVIKVKSSYYYVNKKYCTIVEEPVEYNVGDIVKTSLGTSFIVVEVLDDTLRLSSLEHNNTIIVPKKYVNLLKKATYEEEK